ncbi:hypothetical protein AGABI2DRAFT_193688 [Agaricus bisporus var. bisporus H97]|uniref:hypothetical protein n=1 Tax=Agaricus bisporus var. bisporus (strain H97 / ATCC MYA-4626 / FGSC 10389) TaxID=936046 RepID=UPI00029F4EB4|nr:hypothetical protein AGABI2DRAFT_193688 [Agaricus bisporus var. bisporus H97]EKV45748.1 hypothetical protein AGABI2DRAFT_193688 [Agaricus bisporus var. bisporus H97]
MSEAKHPTIELLSFKASEAMLNDESLINPVLDAVRKAQGSQHIYVGKCVDDGETNTRFVFVTWDSRADHKRLEEDAPVYEQLLKDFTKCADGAAGFNVFHIVSSDDPTMVFKAPVTEIAQVQVKGDGSSPVLKQLFLNWAEATRNAPSAKEYQPFVCGQSLEKTDIHYMIGGWATKDHHYHCIDKEVNYEIGLLADQTEKLTVRHCIVTEYGVGSQ